VDWKYKYFTQEAAFQAEPEIVLKALRAFAADWLDDWKVSETPDGIEARIHSGYRFATATFRVEPAPGGARVAVKMQVERATSLGLMMFDIGGYFSGQIRKWLEALPWWIQQQQAVESQSAGQDTKPVPAGPPIPKPKCEPDRGKRLIAVSVAVILFAYAIVGVMGLITGELYISDNHGGITLHGLKARILSAIMLVIFGAIALRLWKLRKRKQGI